MRIMFRNVLVLALALPLLSAATTAPEAQPLAAPQTMQLSSWQSEIVDDIIVGGSQSVTIISTSSEMTTGTTFRLGQPPCDCSLSEISASTGTVKDGIWTTGDLPAGAAVTLDLRYTSIP